MKRYILIYLNFFIVSLLLVQCTLPKSPSCDALDYCASQVDLSLASLQPCDYTLTPRSIASDSVNWNLVEVRKEEWCAGFWPGILWYNYENTKDENILKYAENYTNALCDIAVAPVYNHDLGFIVNCSYGNGYRLTKNSRYKEILLKSAESLSELFNPNVGTILSWPYEINSLGGHNTVVNNMINLELLFWAADNGGDKTLRDIAISHADRTMEALFREDGTSYYIAVFNPVSGNYMQSLTSQGSDDGSMWSRGQTWGIYGFTMCYRFTKDTRYLNFADKIATAFLEKLPEDMIPYWNFDDINTSHKTPRDASAAAIAASALLELSTYLPDKGYRKAAESILESLDLNYRNTTSPALLRHSTGNYETDSEVDHSIIYADYYYYEALLRLKKLQSGNKI